MATSYTLEQLLDLALCVPEIGVVNFNILHVVIKTIIGVQGIETMRPNYHFENPLIAKIVEREAEYKESKQRSLKDSHMKKVIDEPSDSPEKKEEKSAPEKKEEESATEKREEESVTGTRTKKVADGEFDEHLATFRSGWNEINIGKRVTALEDGLNHFSTEFDKQEEKFSEMHINTAVQNAKIKKLLGEQSEQFQGLSLQFEELKRELLENKDEDDQEEGKLSVEAEIMMLKERNEQLVYQVVDINDQVKELLKSRSLEDDLAVLSKRIEDLETDMDSLVSREADAPFGAPGFGIDMPPTAFVMHKPRKPEDEEAEFDWLNKKLETLKKEKKATVEKQKGPDLKKVEEAQKVPSKISIKEQFPTKKEKKHKHKKHVGIEEQDLLDEEGIPEDLSIEAVKEFLLKKVKPQEQKAEKEVEKVKKHHIEKVTVKDLTAELEQALDLEPHKVTPGKISLEYEKGRAVHSVTKETEAQRSSFDIIKAQEKQHKKEKKERKKKKKEEKEAKKIAAKARAEEKEAALKEKIRKDLEEEQKVEEKEIVVLEEADQERLEVAETEVPSEEVKEKIEVRPRTAKDELLALEEVLEDEFKMPSKDEIEQLKAPEESSSDDEIALSVETTSPIEMKLAPPEEGKAESVEIMDEPVVDAKDVEKIARRASVKAIDAVSIASTIAKPISVIATYPETDEKDIEDVPAPEKDIGFVTITMEEKHRPPSIAEVRYIEKDLITEVEDFHKPLKVDEREEITVPVKEFEEGKIDTRIKTSTKMVPDKGDKDVRTIVKGKPKEEDGKAEKGKGLLHVLKERTDTHVSKDKEKVLKKEKMLHSPKEDQKILADGKVPKEKKKIFVPKEKTDIDHKEKKGERKEEIHVIKEKFDKELAVEGEKAEKELLADDDKEKVDKELPVGEKVEKELPVDGEKEKVDVDKEIPVGEKVEKELLVDGEKEKVEKELPFDFEKEKVLHPEVEEMFVTDEELKLKEMEKFPEEEKLKVPEKEVQIAKKEISREKVDFKEKEIEVLKKKMVSVEEEKGILDEKVDVPKKSKIPEVKVLDKEKISKADMEKDKVVMKEEVSLEEKEVVQPVEEKKQDKTSEEEVVEKPEVPVVVQPPGEGGSEASSETSSSDIEESSSEESSTSEGSESSEDEKREGRTEDFEHTVKVLEEIEAQKRKQLEKETFERLIGTRRKKKARYEIDDDDEEVKLGAYGSGRGLLTEDVLDEHLKNVVTRLDATMRNKSWELDNKIRTIEEQLIQTIQKMANDFENQIQTVNEKVVNRDKHLNRRAEEIEELASSIRILKDLKADKHFVYHEITGKADITEVSKKNRHDNLLLNIGSYF